MNQLINKLKNINKFVPIADRLFLILIFIILLFVDLFLLCGAIYIDNIIAIILTLLVDLCIISAIILLFIPSEDEKDNS